MLNKIFLYALTICSFCCAAMIGDFSPMKVGNTWVYSGSWQYGIFPRWSIETLKIIAMSQNGDFLFYTISDSISSGSPWFADTTVTTTIKKYLELNNNNFLYDSSSKTYGLPEDFFKFHQLPDSILKNDNYLGQSLFSYSDSTGGGCSGFPYKTDQWIQNIGLVSTASIDMCPANPAHGSSSELNLVSFSIDSSALALAPKNSGVGPSMDRSIYADTRNQIHWRGLSGSDHLSVRLYNCKGNLIFSSCQLSGTYVLNASQFSSGAYILRYRLNNGMWKQFSFARS
jgi:hypothetical protein